MSKSCKYNRAAMLPRRLAFLLAVLLLVAGTARIGWIVGHQPLLGYANQFDMGRTSACLGLWPDLPEPARYAAHRSAPITRYVEGERRPDECYVSSELLFAGAAIAAWKVAVGAGIANAAAMDLRYVGAVKAIALVVLAWMLAFLMRERPAWALIHVAVFAIVLADPVVTLWMNTLYTEFAAVFFAYAALVCAAVIADMAPTRRGWYAGFGIALLGLGVSRQQHALLPLCLLMLVVTAIWREKRSALPPLFLVACAAVVLQSFVFTRPPSISAANNANVVLGTILPAAHEQTRAVRQLGLPPHCEQMIGATWYVTMGEDLQTACPEVLTISRLTVFHLLAAEPMIALRTLMKAAPLTQPALLQYVGSDASKSYGSLHSLPSVFALSIAAAIERLPVPAYVGLLLAAAIGLLVSIAAWLAAVCRRRSPTTDVVLTAALTGTTSYAILTSVFGDGMVELPRHAHLGAVALYALVVVGLLQMSMLLATRFKARSNASLALTEARTSWFVPGVVVAIAVVALSAPLWTAAWRAQPLAIGVVDEPTSNRGISGKVVLHGWAMHPLDPPQVVTIVDHTQQVAAHPWQHPTDPAGAALARAFPTYRDSARARFETVVDPGVFSGASLDLRTYAQDRDGTMTEIDRRVLKLRTP